MTEIIPTDVFVVTPVGNGPTIFAKNSHRPKNEVQEIVYIKGENRESNKLKVHLQFFNIDIYYEQYFYFKHVFLQCTYIEIQDTDGPVNSIILSKPSWMWGAEMGSNDQNVCICNIALKSNYNDEDADASIKRLLGTDLVRCAIFYLYLIPHTSY